MPLIARRGKPRVELGRRFVGIGVGSRLRHEVAQPARQFLRPLAQGVLRRRGLALGLLEVQTQRFLGADRMDRRLLGNGDRDPGHLAPEPRQLAHALRGRFVGVGGRRLDLGG